MEGSNPIIVARSPVTSSGIGERLSSKTATSIPASSEGFGPSVDQRSKQQ